MLMGEKVVWRSQPDTGFRLNAGTLAMSIFAAALVLGCLGIATVVDRSIPGQFWSIMGPGLLVGGALCITPLLIYRFERARTKYRITTHRILILRGITVETLPLPPADHLRLHGNAPKSVVLGYDHRNRPVALECLTDAEDVLRTLTALSHHRNAA